LSTGSSQSRRIAGSAARLFAGTLMSRLLGFVRMIVMARYFGARAAMDAFNIAFMIPNLFRGVLGEQAVESSFLPVFQSLVTRGKVREAWRTASVVLNWLFLILVVVAALCAFLAPVLVSRVLAPGFDPASSAVAAQLGRVMSPFLLLIGLAAFYGSLLLAHNQAWSYGMAPTLFNVGWIGTMVLLRGRLGITALGLGVVVGGVLQLAGSAAPLLWGRRRGVVRGSCSVAAGLVDEHAFAALRLVGPVCAAAAIARCASIVDRMVASFLPEGSVSALGYAMPMVLLPFALFGLSVGRAALAPLSEHAASGDTEGFRHSIRTALRLGLFLLIPLSVGTALLARPLADMLLSRTGEFGPAEARMTEAALVYYAPGLAGMGLVSILSRALYALKDTALPLRASFRALLLNAVLSAALALTALRHGGIALATSVAMTFQAALLFAALRGKLGRAGAAEGFGALCLPVAKMCLATAVMSAGVLAASDCVEEVITSMSFAARAARVLIPACAGAAIYGLAMLALDRDDLRRFLRR